MIKRQLVYVFTTNLHKEKHRAEVGSLPLYAITTMNKMQKIMLISAAAIVVVGIALYGGLSLNAKLNKVDELNGQIADTAKPGGSGADGEPAEPGEQPTGETSELSGSVSPGASASPQTGQNTETAGTGSGGTDSEDTPGTDDTPAATDKPATSPDQGGTEEKPTGSSPGSTAPSAEQAKKKKAIDASVTGQMEQLRASCRAASSSLVAQITQELKSDPDASMDTIQSKYLTKVFAAEADCDAQFNQLMGEAQAEYGAAGISEQSMPDWGTQYENAKSQARADALTEIANAMN
ncbi:hypothetical protein KP806_15635 [Paenibacillus sp. N4]|uniref:hypothetical protein n=1 Tax=Paenibacillus vietnamensis TaxID=2590547 RepID=UPI001CD084EF|nr:hypothetical protein [Paenibacillus vietnamensis]MCA0756486.1 hypothetical protein [Paenibacillus vietnamensis]